MITKGRLLRTVLIMSALLSCYAVIAYEQLADSDGQTIVENLKISSTNATKDYGVKRAQIATQEYSKGVKEKSPGCNCGPEIDKYTEGLKSQWCSMFASWVANESGLPLLNPKNQSWKFTKSRDFANYLEKNGTWISKEQALESGESPKIGDYVVFWRGDYEENLGHVDIVVKTEYQTGKLGLIGGNVNNKVSYRKLAYKTNYGFLGFGRPEK